MKIGISTASLFMRCYNEDAFEKLRDANAKICEVFLATFCEYSKEFGTLLNERRKDIQIHSIHTLNTHFEPQLYSASPRVRDDAYFYLNRVLQAGQAMDAKYYTFHGVARLKNKKMNMNFDLIAENTQQIIDRAKPYGITICYENVHWAYYNYVGFFKELKSRCPDLKAVLDIKQAYQSGIDYRDYLEEMGEDIVTAHLSDRDDMGRMKLPGRGVFDFSEILKRIYDKNPNAVCLIEAYKDDYVEEIELRESMEFLQNIVDKF